MAGPDDNRDLIDEARKEIAGMAKEGFDHPSSKPVLVGAGIGTVLGIIVLHGAWPLGLFAGAGIALYTRLKK